jgi:hypothetical protein
MALNRITFTIPGKIPVTLEVTTAMTAAAIMDARNALEGLEDGPYGPRYANAMSHLRFLIDSNGYQKQRDGSCTNLMAAEAAGLLKKCKACGGKLVNLGQVPANTMCSCNSSSGDEDAGPSEGSSSISGIGTGLLIHEGQPEGYGQG